MHESVSSENVTSMDTCLIAIVNSSSYPLSRLDINALTFYHEYENNVLSHVKIVLVSFESVHGQFRHDNQPEHDTFCSRRIWT